MEKLVSVNVVAEWLNLPVDRVYTLSRENLIPTVRLGRSIRFCPKAVQQFVENGGKALPKKIAG